jgi:8-oxo-dGTP diphosphatase
LGTEKDVVAGILFKDERVLIAQRAKDDPLAGLWEFPGGKVENGESPEDSLIREMHSAVHNDYVWVTVNELDQYTFAPADIPLVEKLKKEYH